MAKKERILEEVRELIEGGRAEISGTKKVVCDKKTNQFSIKIPKALARKAGLDENSEFEIVLNPKENTKEKIAKSGLVIYSTKEVVPIGEQGT